MAFDNAILRHPVISTVVAGVILFVLERVYAHLGGTWYWAKSAFAAVAGAISAEVPVPVWLLVPLCALSVIVVVRWLKRLVAGIPPEDLKKVYQDLGQEAFPHVFDQPAVVLSESEEGVLLCLTRADGQNLSVEDIAGRLQKRNLIVQKALEDLVEKGLVDISHNYLYGSSFYLSRDGRDYVIKEGMVEE